MGADGADLSGVEHDDAIGQRDGGEAVGDHQHSGFAGDIGDGFTQGQLIEGIERIDVNP